uniref:Uncharacterized protein n=1 Tax=Mantoniella antarctica TaxID=81844 RepID=A0A7S0S6F2_9CHLO
MYKRAAAYSLPCHLRSKHEQYYRVPPSSLLLRGCVRGHVCLCRALAPPITPPPTPPPSHQCFFEHAESQYLAWWHSAHASGALIAPHSTQLRSCCIRARAST